MVILILHTVGLLSGTLTGHFIRYSCSLMQSLLLQTVNHVAAPQHAEDVGKMKRFTHCVAKTLDLSDLGLSMIIVAICACSISETFHLLGCSQTAVSRLLWRTAQQTKDRAGGGSSLGKSTLLMRAEVRREQPDLLKPTGSAEITAQYDSGAQRGDLCTY